MMKLQFWRFGECEVLQCYYSHFHSDPGIEVSVRVLSMDQIDLFGNYSYSIGP